jgi:hypothetical protein
MSPKDIENMRNSFRIENLRASVLSGGGSTKDNMLLVKELEAFSFDNVNLLVQAISNVNDA